MNCVNIRMHGATIKKKLEYIIFVSLVHFEKLATRNICRNDIFNQIKWPYYENAVLPHNLPRVLRYLTIE